MKREMNFLFAFLLIVLITASVLAVEVDLKDQYKQGETLLAKFSGNFVNPILENNVFFYRGNVRVPMDFDVAKINDEYYVYALLPETEANYSISIEGVDYYKGSQIIDEDIVRNFSIINDTVAFYANPGFVITSEDFSIKVQNLLDKKIILNVATGQISTKNDSGGLFSSFTNNEKVVPEQNPIELKSGEIKNIFFKISNPSQDVLTEISLSSESQTYKIPLFVFANKNSSIGKNSQVRFKLDPSNFEIKTLQREFVREFYIVNTGEVDVTNITISSSKSLEPYVEFSRTFIDELRVNQSLKVEVLFKVSDDINVLDGGINARGGDLVSDISVTAFISDEFTPVNGTETNRSIFKTCSELEGEVCSSEQKCNGESTFASDNLCCLGSCEDNSPKTTSSFGKILGWLMIILAVIILFWFYKAKYKGAGRKIKF